MLPARSTEPPPDASPAVTPAGSVHLWEPEPLLSMGADPGPLLPFVALHPTEQRGADAPVISVSHREKQGMLSREEMLTLMEGGLGARGLSKVCRCLMEGAEKRETNSSQ